MRHVTLMSKEDYEFGGIGLQVKGTRASGSAMNPATTGLLIAHDLLEHQNGLAAIGGIGDELEALGGIWYVRGQHGDMNRKNPFNIHSAETHIASDVMNLARYFSSGIPLRVRVPNTRRHDHDDAFSEIVEIARKNTRAEFNDDEVAEKMAYLNEWGYWRDVIHLLRVGFNKAHNRFERRGRWLANSTFWAIAEAVDAVLPIVEWEGIEFRLSYGKGEAHCQQVYEEEYY